MNGEDVIIMNLRAETEEAVELIRNAEEILRRSPHKNFRTAADFLHQSSRLVEKHKKHKIDRLKAVFGGDHHD